MEPLLAPSSPFSTIEGAEGEVRVGWRTTVRREKRTDNRFGMPFQATTWKRLPDARYQPI